MWPPPGHGRTCCPRLRRQGGFTLFETIVVIAMLTLVSLGLIAMQPQVFKTQTAGRDEFVGFELTRACAERLLAVRRSSGYAAVNNSLCAGMKGNVVGFNDPAVALVDATGTAITSGSPCSSATCTATISIAKTSGPAAALTALTLRLSDY
jgi:Tfp pilus assembly protein PilV